MKIISVAAAASLLLYHGGTSNPPPPYTGPCDLTSCVAAYSVTHALTTNYSGPLFSICKSTSPFNCVDIPQDGSHKANFAALVVANCTGGVNSGCNWNAVYDQMHGAGVNVIQQFDFSKPLRFSVDSTTGLPVFDSSVGPNTATFLITSNPGAADATADLAVTGAPAQGASRSVVVVARAPNSSVCCGQSGWYHKASDTVSSVLGTDFAPIMTKGPPQFSTGHYGWGLDLENGVSTCIPSNVTPLGGSNDLGTSITDQILITTWNGSTNTGVENNNGHAVLSYQDSSCVPHNFAHLGGGGDMTPAISYIRDTILTGSVMSSGDQAAVIANFEAFYSALTFP